MKVAVDLRMSHYSRSGFYRYGKGLVSSLASFGDDSLEIVLLINSEDTSSYLDVPRTTCLPCDIGLFSENEGFELQSLVAGEDIDLVHFPHSYFPENYDQPAIVSVHDFSPIVCPETIDPEYRRFYFKTIQQLPAATAVLLDHPAMARECVSMTRVRQENVFVVPPVTPYEDQEVFFGSRTLSEAERESIQSTVSPFLLSVGAMDSRKNYKALLDVFKVVRLQSKQPLKLVIVSSTDRESKEVQATFDSFDFKEDVVIFKSCDDATLKWLYENAELFINCSSYEGFYFPLLEATFAGCLPLTTPVPVASTQGFPGELIIDANDKIAVADKVISLLASRVERESLYRFADDAFRHQSELVKKDRFARCYQKLLARLSAKGSDRSRLSNEL